MDDIGKFSNECSIQIKKSSGAIFLSTQEGTLLQPYEEPFDACILTYRFEEVEAV